MILLAQGRIWLISSAVRVSFDHSVGRVGFTPPGADPGMVPCRTSEEAEDGSRGESKGKDEESPAAEVGEGEPDCKEERGGADVDVAID